jgi:hypothetical protein
MKHTKRGGVHFDQSEIEEMTEKALELQADPAGALKHYVTKQWVWLLMLEKIADSPPDSRSGLDKTRWAMEEYNKLAARLLKGVAKGAEKPETEARGSDAGTPGSQQRAGGKRVPKLAPPPKRKPASSF